MDRLAQDFAALGPLLQIAALAAFIALLVLFALAFSVASANRKRAALEAALAARSGATTISLRSLSAGNAGEVLRAALGDGETDVAQLRSALTAAADYAPEA